MLNVINGVYHPQEGTITFLGKKRHDMDTHEAAAQGIARTFQNIALFKGMSVLDNLMTGRNLKMNCNFLQQALYWGPARREELEHRRKIEEVIDFLEIEHIRKTPVGRLPYGLQKRVELGRALAAEPTLLLLDEPMAGMNVEEKQDMCRFILDVNDQFGTTILLIEHDMGVVMDISTYVVVLGLRHENRRRHARRRAFRPGGDQRLSGRHPLKARDQGHSAMQFFFEVLIGGLLAGVMYSLVALGFVLIYKASGVFNFAQGAMVFFAALTFVSLVERGFSFWAAFLITFAAMVVIAIATERVVLRPLVNQAQITLFMATIGLTFVLEGLSQLFWGSQPHGLELGITDMPFEWLSENTGMNVSQFDLFAALVAGFLVAGLALFFQKTRIGRALRAVADDHQAALAVGIPLQQIWAIVWTVAGFVALVSGLLWGARNGVQFALTFTALKALPVLILGGFESVAGAIIGGLIIGASEKLAEIYIPQFLNGPLSDAWGVSVNLAGLEIWFPYALALAFLLIRPEGLFGEKHIDRV